jgi:hypothetical protein
VAGVIAPEFRLLAPIRLQRFVDVVIVIAVRSVHVFGWRLRVAARCFFSGYHVRLLDIALLWIFRCRA